MGMPHLDTFEACTRTLQKINVMTIKESNITINIKDMDRSIAFYKSMGFTEKIRWQNHYAKLVLDGVIIGLHPASPENLKNNSGNVSIGLHTDNFDQARSYLQKLSIAYQERKEEGGEFLHFADPDGTALYIIKPKW
jgi:catechol 2,3-dioxygenase-like lactoylglutathione lyase family enzyme